MLQRIKINCTQTSRVSRSAGRSSVSSTSLCDATWSRYKHCLSPRSWCFPFAVEIPRLDKAFRHRRQEICEHFCYLCKINRGVIQMILGDKCPPLMCNCRFNIEFRGEGKRRSFNRRPSMFKGGFDRLREDLPVEVEVPRQQPDIIEILHTTVDVAEVDHGLKFFSDGRLAAVSLHPGCWKVKNRWIVAENRLGRDEGIEGDVKLKRHPCVIESTLKSDTDALIVRVLPDNLTDYCILIEVNAVWLNLERADFTDEILNCSNVVSHSPQQIYIHGWSLLGGIPDPQHERTLESELVGMCRLRKAIQKPFHRKETKKFIEWTIRQSGMILQTLSYGRGEIGDVFSRHSSVSRYGRMIFSTRHTAANFIISLGISIRLS